MPKGYKLNLEGQKFGRMLVLSRQGLSSSKNRMWLCRCDCGVEKVVIGKCLVNGETKSCGCLNREVSRRNLDRTKGTGWTRNHRVEYSTWTDMLARCRNPKRSQFKNYGGRGILVCDRWLNFENFLADMGIRPPGMSIDRIDVNGNYEPANCRWATRKMQMSNRRNNTFIFVDGTKVTISEAADRHGIGRATLRNRIARGWPRERWFETPIFSGKKQKHLSIKVAS
jgi:hypothetical protein